ncbi:MAG: SDR family oxidoreductase [Chloroflexia bacterium]|nr:SDR family oxidoreductase [Chloroflexia bacterium]
MSAQERPGKVALVTGGSRGVGAATAIFLAERGFDVAVNYREKARRAKAVIADVEAAGRRGWLAQSDLTDDDVTTAMFDRLQQQAGRIDLLVLNASGGLEAGMAEDYAIQVNMGAQTRALDLTLPLMPYGGRVVFVTSHLAHFHGEKPVYPAYEPVAASKKAGEMALRERIPELASRDIALIVVSGDLIDGSITPRLMERQSPGLIDARREEAGGLPTVEEFARAIADATVDERLVSGETVYVGSKDWKL